MISYLLLLIILGIASYTDYKIKEVPNSLIVLGIIFALFLSSSLEWFGFNLLISFVIFYFLWKVGDFGAGDAKLFILITLFLESLFLTGIIFVFTGIIFVLYNILSKKQEKRLVPFILFAFIIKIIIYILL